MSVQISTKRRLAFLHLVPTSIASSVFGHESIVVVSLRNINKLLYRRSRRFLYLPCVCVKMFRLYVEMVRHMTTARHNWLISKYVRRATVLARTMETCRSSRAKWNRTGYELGPISQGSCKTLRCKRTWASIFCCQKRESITHTWYDNAAGVSSARTTSLHQKPTLPWA